MKEWLGWLEDRGRSARGDPQGEGDAERHARRRGRGRQDRNTIPRTASRYVPRTELREAEPPRDLTSADLAKFLDATPPEWRLFFELLAHTGLRVSEALGLTWANVWFGDDPSLEVVEQVYEGERKRLKSRHSIRTLPLSPGLARALERWRGRAEYGAPDDPVFPNAEGRPMNAGNLYRRVFAPARDASGVAWPKGRAFHAFRHYAASVQHHHGKSARQVCDWLGHHDPAFTLRTYVGQRGRGDSGTRRSWTS